MTLLCRFVCLGTVWLLLAPLGLIQAQDLTVQFPIVPPPTVISNVLAAHGDNWNWRRGTTEPQANWNTTTIAGLDGTWLPAAPGGFGYGDDLIFGEQTRVNPGMLNVHSTLYIRRSFLLPPDADGNPHLVLTVDFDDGFVAYVDGVEVARRNVPGQPGTHVANTATTGGVSHEASCCQSPNPPVVIDLGPIFGYWSPGEHILAVIGVNQVRDSSDFHIIVDLASVTVIPPPDPPTLFNRGLYALSTEVNQTLKGSNTVSGSVRMTVNGDDAPFDAGAGTWSFATTLSPGFNRLYIATHDAQGQILDHLTQDIVYEAATMQVSGTLPGNTVWNDPTKIVYVTEGVTVPAGATLEVGAGVVVLLAPGAFITATTNGAVHVEGTREQLAHFLPSTTGSFGWLMAQGDNAMLRVRHGEVVSGQVRVFDGAIGIMEDAIIRDLPDLSREVIECVDGAGFTARRVYMTRFTEGDSVDTPLLFEDSLLEGFLVDGMDIKAATAPLVVRRTTFRNADPNNSNADAIDFGPGAGTVERCLIHDFPDKGVSIGGAPGTRISDTLFYRCGIGISAYSSLDLVAVNCTIADCETGIQFRDNPTRAVGVMTNMIVWGNVTNVAVRNTSLLDMHFSDIEATNYPGTGNISADPLFASPATDDFHLLAGSPALGTGAGGSDMGVPWPIGGFPSTPDRLVALALGDHQTEIQWQDTSENEDGFEIQRSADGTTWETLGMAPMNAVGYRDTSALLADHYYYRVQATNDVGHSEFSNRARGRSNAPLVLTIVQPKPDEVVLGFAAAAGQSYTLQSRISLTEGTWSNWLSFPASPIAAGISVTNTPSGTQAYFRLSSP